MSKLSGRASVRSCTFGGALAVLVAASAGAARAEPVAHEVAIVSGLQVDRYSWKDSRGQLRSVSLKRQGSGNPGNGGYAVQMTYRARVSGVWRTITVDAHPGGDGGFGYFVSHERYRDFTDGDNDTIAGKVFGADDSPLGSRLAVAGRRLADPGPSSAAHRFTLTYPRYGTVDPIPKDENGVDVRRTPTARSKLKLYDLPITIIWYFQSGTDHPRIQTTVSLAQVPGPDRVDFDVRGPYGVMRFADRKTPTIDTVTWGDRRHFSVDAKPLTRNRSWRWTTLNDGARYHALIAGGYEMGLIEPRRFAQSLISDNWAGARGKTSTSYNGGQGCPDQAQLLPCDWEWPYQSAQYSLPYDNPNGTTTFPKIAWGSAPYWGSGPSLPRVWDSNTTSKRFVGFPAGGRIIYSVCVVLGRTIAGGLTRAVAAGPAYNCAET